MFIFYFIVFTDIRIHSVQTEYICYFCILFLYLFGSVRIDVGYLYTFFHRRVLPQCEDELPVGCLLFDVILVNKESDKQVGTSEPHCQADERDENKQFISPPTAEDDFKCGNGVHFFLSFRFRTFKIKSLEAFLVCSSSGKK